MGSRRRNLRLPITEETAVLPEEGLGEERPGGWWPQIKSELLGPSWQLPDQVGGAGVP